MSLLVSARQRLGSFELDASFESGGRLTALFGSSGSGKTSLVNIIAGLIRPAQGRVSVDGRVLVDTAAGVSVPTHLRRIGYVFQDARLFPHLTVSQNLRYGHWFTPATERYADMAAVVNLLGIGHLLDRRPNLLSGGERQRVAIGRALIASPRLILMDEPLASLDDARKAEILPYIERLRDEIRIPIVYVSHSLAEVARLATDMVVLADGRVKASGPAREVMQRLDLMPEAEFGEAGAILDLKVERHEEAAGLTLLRSSANDWHVPLLESAAGSFVRVRIRARDVMIATEQPRGLSALNISPGAVAEIALDSGPEALVKIDCAGDRLVARITRHSVQALGLEPGRRIFAVVKAITFDRTNTGKGLDEARSAQTKIKTTSPSVR